MDRSASSVLVILVPAQHTKGVQNANQTTTSISTQVIQLPIQIVLNATIMHLLVNTKMI